MRDLARLEPDLVVGTGDFLGHRDSVPVVLDALGDLLDRPGVFVFGSNDYYEPTMRNPLRYLLPDDGRRATGTPQLPWRDLRSAFGTAGWLDLTNTFGRLDVAGRSVRVRRRRRPAPRLRRPARGGRPGRRRRRRAAGRRPRAVPPGARPVRRGTGTTRCSPATPTAGRSACRSSVRSPRTPTSTPPAPRACTGTRPTPGPGDPGSTWLHVSAGLGTSPYVRLRVACRPEASLVTLTARPG